MADVHISVISPVYGSKASLPTLYARLCRALSALTGNFEIILVNDGCPQDSWTVITKLCAEDSRVRGINLSRNFGQHAAITAGLDHAKGDWVVVMDCDLQDQPEEIPKLYAKAQEGYDVVFGERSKRHDPLFKQFFSRAYKATFGYLSGIKRDADHGNFGIFSRKVIESVKQYREQSRGFATFISMVGFKKTAIPINHSPRFEGKSSYNFAKNMNLAVDLIIAHSNKPLKLSINLGFFISLFSVLYACWLVIRYLIYAIPVPGWTSLMVAMFFMFGLMFALLGIVGLYVGKVFDETKHRPLYFIADALNLEDSAPENAD